MSTGMARFIDFNVQISSNKWTETGTQLLLQHSVDFF